VKDFPMGAYLRENIAGSALEPSPFLTISTTMYYVVVTTTTVGYGDVYPTSQGGRALACAFAYVGIIIWTFPIAVVGKNFVDEFKTLLAVEREVEEMQKLAATEQGEVDANDRGLVRAVQLLNEVRVGFERVLCFCSLLVFPRLTLCTCVSSGGPCGAAQAAQAVHRAAEEAADMIDYTDRLAKDGRVASNTAEVLRLAIAPPEQWLAHF